MAELTPDYSKRDCSLPPGCKDLIDVLRLQKRKPTKADLVELRLQKGKLTEAEFVEMAAPWAVLKPGFLLPTEAEQKAATVIWIKSRLTVMELAALLHRKLFEIVADLIDLKLLANVDQSVTFEVAAKVAVKYGYIAKQAAS